MYFGRGHRYLALGPDRGAGLKPSIVMLEVPPESEHLEKGRVQEFQECVFYRNAKP